VVLLWVVTPSCGPSGVLVLARASSEWRARRACRVSSQPAGRDGREVLLGLGVL